MYAVTVFCEPIATPTGEFFRVELQLHKKLRRKNSSNAVRELNK